MGRLDIAIQVPKSHGSHATKERLSVEDLQVRYNHCYIDKDNDEDGNQHRLSRVQNSLTMKALRLSEGTSTISMDQRLDAVVRAGLFTDREQLVNRAIQALFALQPNLRADAAVELFRRDEVSLLRAAEMAGLDFESFRILLQARGIDWTIEAESAEAMDEAGEAFSQNRG